MYYFHDSYKVLGKFFFILKKGVGWEKNGSQAYVVLKNLKDHIKVSQICQCPLHRKNMFCLPEFVNTQIQKNRKII